MLKKGVQVKAWLIPRAAKKCIIYGQLYNRCYSFVVGIKKELLFF